MNKYLWVVSIEDCYSCFWILTRNMDPEEAARKAKRLIPMLKKQGKKPGKITRIESHGFIDLF